MLVKVVPSVTSKLNSNSVPDLDFGILGTQYHITEWLGIF
jgi:hypothetical protein